MPIFEYQCGGCGQRFERLQRRQPETATRCACGSEQVERIWFSRVAVASRERGSRESACAAPPPGGCCGGGACQSQ